eukprot:1959999-Alexandrium_andersonii.AAC.1
MVFVSVVGPRCCCRCGLWSWSVLIRMVVSMVVWVLIVEAVVVAVSYDCDHGVDGGDRDVKYDGDCHGGHDVN